MALRKYDSTVARIAGNIASGLNVNYPFEVEPDELAKRVVSLARAIVAETIRTEPTEGFTIATKDAVTKG